MPRFPIVLKTLLLAACFCLLSGCALFDMNDTRVTHFHTVVLDPGHGGIDSGTRSVSGWDEKKLTLDVAQRVKPLLEAHGYRVVMTRTQDVFVPLGRRTAIANKQPNAIFVSIHFNSSHSSAAHGIEAYYYNWSSEQLAERILRQLSSIRQTRKQGVKKAVFFVLHHNQCPATLLELGFVSNPSENSTIQKPTTREALAQAIAQGIASCHE